MGAEVIHLGHNRSVDEIVTAALQEDVQGIAISSYQGGHVEYFKYMVDLLQAARRRAHIQVFGGGGGVIVPAEIRELQAYGVTPHLQPRGRPAHGPAGHDRRDGDALRQSTCRRAPRNSLAAGSRRATPSAWRALAQLITALENGRGRRRQRRRCRRRRRPRACPVLGITGTGGAGKSSLTDELIRRFRLDQDDALRSP
jgi:methylmalonyl-CoA mutase